MHSHFSYSTNGVLNGLADLATDAFGYQGTAAENSGIAAGVMYNIASCGGVGGSGSGGGSGGGGSGGNSGSGHWLGEYRGKGSPPRWGMELAEYIDDIYRDMSYWSRNQSTAAVTKVDGQYYVTSTGDSRAAKFLKDRENEYGYIYLPNNTTDHAERFLYNYFGGNIDGIGVSHRAGPCGPDKKNCRDFFLGIDFLNVFWTGEYK